MIVNGLSSVLSSVSDFESLALISIGPLSREKGLHDFSLDIIAKGK